MSLISPNFAVIFSQFWPRAFIQNCWKKSCFINMNYVFFFSMDNLEQFVNDLLDNKLEAYMKSEAVPDNSNNDVKVYLT